MFDTPAFSKSVTVTGGQGQGNQQPLQVTTVALTPGGGFRVTGDPTAWGLQAENYDLGPQCYAVTYPGPNPSSSVDEGAYNDILFAAGEDNTIETGGTPPTYGESSPAWTNWNVVDPQGGMHPVALVSSACDSVTASPSYDNSGIMVTNVTMPASNTATLPTITLPDGTAITSANSVNGQGNITSQTRTAEDSNGNKTVTTDTFPNADGVLSSSITTDNTGRNISVLNGIQKVYTTPNGNTVSGFLNTTISYKDSSGTTQSYIINYEAIDVTPHLCTPVAESSQQQCNEQGTPIFIGGDIIKSGATVVPSTLALPDQATSYTFNWANGSMGELESVTLPTGGKISYSYTTLCTVPPGGGAGGYQDCRRAVSTRTESFDGSTAQSPWQYSTALQAGDTYATTGTVTDPAGNQEVHQYSLLTIDNINTTSTYQTSVKTYAGSAKSGTLLRTVTTAYTGEVLTGGPDLGMLANIRPTSVTTSVGSLVKQVQTDYETYTYSDGNTVARPNPTEVREYGFGTGSSGSLYRFTDYQYLHTSSATYANQNIVNRQTSVATCPGAATPPCSKSSAKANQTTFEYDIYTAGISASTAANHDPTFNTKYTLRGNQTAKTAWVNTGGSSLQIRNQYDDAGNVVATTDPKNNTTNFSYVDTWADQPANCAPITGQARAYLVSSTNALGQSTTYSNYSCSGLHAKTTDSNSRNTYIAYDWAGRQTCLTSPDGGQKTSTYSDATGTVSSTVLMSSNQPAQNCGTVASGAKITAAEIYDGFGGKTQEQTSDPIAPDITDISYDSLRRVSTLSNPHRATSTSTDGTTTFAYDALSEKTQQTNPDGTGLQWCYNGGSTNGQTNCKSHIGSQVGTWVDQTDEAGNSWQYTFDAFGRMIEAVEPNGTAAAPTMETDYGYDVLGNLTSVTQWGGPSGTTGSRARSFNYDGLSRLTSAANPETGSISYSYLSNASSCSGDPSLPCSKTDARGRTVTYSYDGLNRILSKTYSDNTPSSCYRYDVAAVPGISANIIGRMTGEWTQAGSCPSSTTTQIPSAVNTAQAMAYDPVGRLQQEAYCTPQNCSYSNSVMSGYDLAGNMTSLTYPDSRVVQQQFDSAGRLNSVNYASWNNATVGTSYFSEGALSAGGVNYSGYDPAGHLTSATFGNGVVTGAGYDARLRLNSLGYYNGSGTPLWLKNMNWSATGNLQSTADLIKGTSRQFGYDTLNRLKVAEDTTGTGGSTGTQPATGEGGNGSDTNILANPQNLGTGGWTGVRVSMTYNSVLAPDGTTTAGAIVATSGSADSFVVDSTLYPPLYENAPVQGSVWLRVPSGTLALKIFIVNIGYQGQSLVASADVTLTTSWQQFQLAGTTQNGITDLHWQTGGIDTLTSGQEVDMWGLQLGPQNNGGSITNLLPYSQQIGGTTWSAYCAAPGSNPSNFTLNTTDVVAPDGSSTATKYVTPNPLTCGTSVTEGAYNSIAGGLTTGQTYTTSVWLRGQAGDEVVELGLNDCALSNVSLKTTWQRFSFTSPSISSAISGCSSGSRGFEVIDNSTPGATYYVWGAQVEAAAAAGEYVATLDSPVTVTSDSTNILANSQSAGAADWSIAQGTYTANTTTAPDGTSTADSAVSTGSNTYFRVYANNPAQYDNTAVTASVYLAVPSGSRQVGMSIVNAATTGNGTLASSVATVTTTWQRFDLPANTGNGLSALYLDIGGGTSITAGNPLYVWGVQMVPGTGAGAYDPTAGTGTGPNGGSVVLAPNGLLESYNYDAFGNMTSSGNFNFSQTYGTNNRLTSWQYDASGNLLVDGFNNDYTYDAEGRISAISGSNSGAYVYDAEGNRVEKSDASVTDYIYLGGKQLARLSGGAWTDLIYGANGMLAEVGGTQTAQPVYRLLDHLGTQVDTVDNNGLSLSATDYAPFGQVFTGGSTDPYLFTGKERDAESGLDYMDARYYGSSMGRFMSPDPVFATVNRLADPQQWNMYSYGRNNPLSNSDPTGLDFNLTCSQNNGSTCVGGLQGQIVNGSFQATDVDMNDPKNASAGYSDQFGNNYTGTFDQNNGVSFTNTATNATSSNSQFIDGSDQTNVNGSGAFSGIQGQFNSNCGGSCEAKGSLYDLPGHTGAVSALEKMVGASFEDNLNFFGGHGKSISFRFGDDQLTHIVNHLAGPDAGKQEVHFEGHAPGRDLTNFVLHQVDAIRDSANHQSAQEPRLP